MNHLGSFGTEAQNILDEIQERGKFEILEPNQLTLWINYVSQVLPDFIWLSLPVASRNAPETQNSDVWIMFCLKILGWWIIVYLSTSRLHWVVMTTCYCLYSWWLRWWSVVLWAYKVILQSNMICFSNLYFE